MSKFEVGDLVRCIQPAPGLGLGQIYRVSDVHPEGDDIKVDEGLDYYWCAYRFEHYSVPAPVFVTNTPRAGESAEQTAARSALRVFASGATRDNADNKLDYEGFLSPLVLERYAQYMHTKRMMPDGTKRDSDNWQRGIPLAVYIKSLWRHFVDVWKEHRGIMTKEGIEDALCAVIFNASGYLHEYLKGKNADRD